MGDIDLARREAVMARSQQLGHCICNPAHPCPCPTLLNANLCPCAGERAAQKPSAVALTRQVRKAGCASKIGQADLLQILRHLPETSDPRVLVGRAAGDDAGVFRINETHALVQTVDVFTPCVDDPYLFGQIAAANSLSDVYAMGGTPLTALSIVGFPIDELDGSIMEEMLRGGIETLEAAGCALLGGHSMNDDEIKCGFAVTGLVPLHGVVERDRAQAGDLLVLTKPLGTGMVAFAAQLGLAGRASLDEAGQWMAVLNNDAADLMVKYDAHACTDITGYGLAGHLVSMTRGSGVDAEIDLSAVPVFGIVPACIARGVYSGAVDRNQAYSMAFVQGPESTNGAPTGMPVLFDPQTSGGLLVALPPREAKAFVLEMAERGHRATAIIGRITARRPGQPTSLVRVIDARLKNLVGTRDLAETGPAAPAAGRGDASVSKTHDDSPCCEGPPPTPGPEAGAPSAATGDPLQTFKAFMAEANKPGLIDARSKRLLAIVLAIAHHCEPCLKIHLDTARSMGISRAEIDEAANLAIAFGGCPAMMFYQETCKRIGM
jgi:selenide, water dikinase